VIPERIIFVSRGVTVHCCIKFWHFTLFHDEYARSNNPQIILGVSSWKKSFGSPIQKWRASWRSMGRLFCLTTRITNSPRTHRVTTGSKMLAAIPFHRESESTLSVQHAILIPGFYVSCLKQMTEMYFFSSDTHFSPNKHFVRGTSMFHNLGEPTWSD
jgi:hypothetical protein